MKEERAVRRAHFREWAKKKKKGRVGRVGPSYPVEGETTDGLSISIPRANLWSVWKQ